MEQIEKEWEKEWEEESLSNIPSAFYIGHIEQQLKNDIEWDKKMIAWGWKLDYHGNRLTRFLYRHGIKTRKYKEAEKRMEERLQKRSGRVITFKRFGE